MQGIEWTQGKLSPSYSTISIVNATYGIFDSQKNAFDLTEKECIGYGGKIYNSTATTCDFTNKFRAACDDKRECSLSFGNQDCPSKIKDPAPGCAKTLKVYFRCLNEDGPREISSEANEHERRIALSC